MAESRQWREQLWQAGLAWITGPVEYGGRALPAAYERAYHAPERGYRTPSKQPFLVALGMVAPTILAHGPEEMQARHLPEIYRGASLACQLFSEPGPVRTWVRRLLGATRGRRLGRERAEGLDFVGPPQ